MRRVDVVLIHGARRPAHAPQLRRTNRQFAGTSKPCPACWTKTICRDGGKPYGNGRPPDQMLDAKLSGRGGGLTPGGGEHIDTPVWCRALEILGDAGLVVMNRAEGSGSDDGFGRSNIRFSRKIIQRLRYCCYRCVRDWDEELNSRRSECWLAEVVRDGNTPEAMPNATGEKRPSARLCTYNNCMCRTGVHAAR